MPAAQNPNRASRIEQRQNARQANPAVNANRPANPAAALRQQRQADRVERRLQQREDRSLRNVPTAQRAQRRQEIQQQRAQRRDQQQNARQSIQNQNQNAQRQTQNAAQGSGTRRNGQARVNAQAAQQGRFAAAAIAARQGVGQNARGNRQQARAERLVARQAWRRGLRASFVPWAGAVFWPYAYSDLFDYTFFPYSYDDAYWSYAYDDMFDGVFYADGGPYGDYAYAPATTGSASGGTAQARVADRTAQQACAEPGQGITAWPIAQIQRAVDLNPDQKQLLGELERLANEAAQTFKASCTTKVALTPPGRLQAVTTRLQATLEAVQIVKSPLNAFYNSLSDEQKARFNRIGPTLGQSAQDKTARQDTLGAGAKTCGDAKPGLVNLPIESIEDTVKPTEQQQGALDKLEQATNAAVGKLAAACPDDIAQTPTGRMEATETRLKAMLEAARTVQPALEDFYAALSDEQKSRFNTMQATNTADNG
jgi:hypothetical protein